MSRTLQHRLHTQLRTAVDLLDLPLTEQHIEGLAVELTPAIAALLAEAQALAVEDAPVAYGVTADTTVNEETGVATAEYAGCVSRIQADVDLDSPAAALAQKLRGSQHDVTATDVPDATTLGLTVRPQSIDCWRWWLNRLNVPVGAVETHGEAATATGHYKGVAINLRGDGVPALLADKDTARLAGVLVEPAAGHPW